MNLFTNARFILSIFSLLQIVTAGDFGGLKYGEFFSRVGITVLEAQSIEPQISQAKGRHESLAGLACRTFQLALSENEVDTLPLNQTVVAENW
jgi:hypothetical protein